MNSRRVIFVDPELWTARPSKENHMTNTETPNPRDVRMAAALTIHHRSGNGEGMAEIVRETVDTDRAAQLLHALLDLYRIYITQTRTQVGIQYLGAYVGQLAEVDDRNEITLDMQRAARVLYSHSRDDFDGINAVLTETRADKRGSHLLLALLDLYDATLPELLSEPGRRWLDAVVAALVAQEDDHQ